MTVFASLTIREAQLVKRVPAVFITFGVFPQNTAEEAELRPLPVAADA